MKNVLHTPNISRNLISISQLTAQNNLSVEFDSNSFLVKDKGTRKELLQGKAKDGLYHIETINHPQAYFTAKTISTADVLDWHNKLGHPSHKVLVQVLKSCNLSFSNDSSIFCTACQYGKAHKLPFNNYKSKATEPLELIHSDLWGPAPISSRQGFKYYINFLDDYSRFSWVFPLKTKNEALGIFKQFKLLVEKQFEESIKTLHTDSGGEFIAFAPFLKEQGITHIFTCPYTSEQNGRVERKHRQIVEYGLILLAQAKMPFHFWWEAFHTAVFNINRLPTSALSNKTPFETLYKKKPDFTILHPFGSTAFPLITPYNNHKLQFHSQKCLFVGYSTSHKGFKCLSPTGKLYLSRHVTFNHHDFPFLSLFSHDHTVQNIPNNNLNLSSLQIQHNSFPSISPFLTSTTADSSPDEHRSGFDSSFVPSKNLSIQNNLPSSAAKTSDSSTRYMLALDQHSQNQDSYQNILSDSSSTKYMLPRHSPVITHTEDSRADSNTTINAHPMITRGKRGIVKTKTPFAGTISMNTVPNSVSDTLADPVWRQAMSDEFKALQQNNCNTRKF